MSESAREFLGGVNDGGKRCVEFLKLLPIAVAVEVAVALQTGFFISVCLIDNV